MKETKELVERNVHKVPIGMVTCEIYGGGIAMARIIPEMVENTDELEKVLKKDAKVIFVDNEYLIDSLKKRVNAMSKKRKNSTKGIKNGVKVIGAGVALFLMPWNAAIYAGAAMVYGGTALLGVSAAIKLNNTISSKLKNYTYIDKPEEKILILVKEAGVNCFNFEIDEIDYDGIESGMQNEKRSSN